MGAPSHEKWGQAGGGFGCILIPCLGWKMGGCHGTPTCFQLHTGALEGGPPAPYCAPTALQDHIPPPAFPPRSLLFHSDCRFPIAVATSGMATQHLLQGHVSTCPPHSWCPPPEGWGGWCGWPRGRFRLQGASLGIAICPEPPHRPQNQRLSVLQQLKRRAGRFALEATGLILPTGARLGTAGTWQLLLGLSGGSRGGRGGKRLGGECR